MPKGTIDKTGEITITYNPSAGDALIVAGHAVVPCERCGAVHAFTLGGAIPVTFTCAPCWDAIKRAEEAEAPAPITGEEGLFGWRAKMEELLPG